MNQNDILRLAQEFLHRMGSDTEPAEIAKLFSETLEWDIGGDTGVLPWMVASPAEALSQTSFAIRAPCLSESALRFTIVATISEQ